MFSKSLTKHFKGVGSRFTQLHAKLVADILLNFAIHHRQNETQSQKQNNACSQHGVMWQTDAIGFQKCDLGSLLIFFHGGNYNNKSPGTF
jgi:hypothetical protein